MTGHRVVWIVGAYSLFVFSQPILESTFGPSNVKAATFTFKPIDHISSITVCKAFNTIDFFTEDIFESGCFNDVHTVMAAATSEVADWTMQPREFGGGGGLVAPN